MVCLLLGRQPRARLGAGYTGRRLTAGGAPAQRATASTEVQWNMMLAAAAAAAAAVLMSRSKVAAVLRRAPRETVSSPPQSHLRHAAASALRDATASGAPPPPCTRLPPHPRRIAVAGRTGVKARAV